MPKHSLSRRHRRQSNLAQLVSLTDPHFSRATPRMVSEEDVRLEVLSSQSTSSSTLSLLLSPVMPSSEKPMYLKRFSPSQSLNTLVPFGALAELNVSDSNGEPSSPWGHFVDLLQHEQRCIDNLEATATALRKPPGLIMPCSKNATDPYSKGRRLLSPRNLARESSASQLFLQKALQGLSV
jgi:hypothetical protein